MKNIRRSVAAMLVLVLAIVAGPAQTVRAASSDSAENQSTAYNSQVAPAFNYNTVVGTIQRVFREPQGTNSPW